MPLVLANRVQETATPNTTVSFTLTGTVPGFQAFSVIGNGNTTYYSATDASGGWEVGLGTYSSTGPTLTRTTVYASSNTGSPVTFSGTVNVFVTYPSGRSVNLDASGNVSALGTVSSGTWQGSTVGVAYGGTGVTASSGPNSVMIRDANQNVAVNRLNQANATTTAAGGTTALVAASSYSQTLVGTGNQTYTMPDATGLTTGLDFIFNNNATGTLTLRDYAGGLIGTVASGGACELILLDNSTVAGTWDLHAFLPEGVTFGTNDFNLGTSVITGGTWQGGTIQPAYGGTGLTTFVGANNALFSTGASTLTAGTLPVAAGGTGATTLTGYVFGNGTGAFTASTSIPNSATTATSANTANAIVARDASGNFSAGTITAALSGNASTATTATNQSGGTVNATTGAFSQNITVGTGTAVDPSNVFGFAAGQITEPATGFTSPGIVIGGSAGQRGAIVYGSNTMYFGTETGANNTMNVRATLTSTGAFEAELSLTARAVTATDGYLFASRFSVLASQVGIQLQSAGVTDWWMYLDSGTNEVLKWYNALINADVMTLDFLGNLDTLGTITQNGIPVLTTSGTQTLTNKRFDPRVSSTATASSVTPDISAFDQYCFTALTGATLQIFAPVGTPVDGNKLLFRILDNGTPVSLSWNSTYTPIGVPLPTTTTANKMTYVGCIYNAANARWDVIAVTTQA